MEVYPNPITKQCHEKILEQMKKSIGIIIKNKEIVLFCYLKYKNKKVPAIIINNYINNEKYLNKINVFMNNKEEIIDIEKIIYKDIFNNISIIKLKNVNPNVNFIEIDDKLYEKDSEMYYRQESIYILQYEKMAY